MIDSEFSGDQALLQLAIELMRAEFRHSAPHNLPTSLPEDGLGSKVTLEFLAPSVLGGAAHLASETSFAHMDPPTPLVTWATTLWNASLNQNLLHPGTAPVARLVEERVVQWLAPYFGMSGGHMTPGSTLANLTVLWAARECAGIEEVIASDAAHLSIAKSAHILGLRFRALPTGANGALLADALPTDLSKSVLVLTAGTTSAGAIDPLGLAAKAGWTHVDAAWAGPLRLTKYASRLNGIALADSVSISAHKWFFQPKESALVLFKDADKAHAAVSFGGAYLATPNIGVLGSHGAVAVPLLAMLLAWGRKGFADRIERCMGFGDALAQFIASDSRLKLFAQPQTGVVLWRPINQAAFSQVAALLPVGLTSITTIADERWFRNVASNPNLDMRLVISAVKRSIDNASRTSTE
jgi:L-2,4-diaminobutyrate decarboxylase